jgi:NADH-quinone oxidoreductase subunit E
MNSAGFPEPKEESGTVRNTHNRVTNNDEISQRGSVMSASSVSRILEKHEKDGAGLIAILEDIQASYGYLPREALETVATQTGHPLVDIFGAATFYKSFSLKPRGQHLISVCLGTACHVRSAPIIVGEFERQLGIKVGETTADNEFSLETVACLGACALGPIVVVDGRYFSNVDTNAVKRIIRKARAGLDKVVVKADQRTFPVEVSCARCNHSLMDSGHLIDGYPTIRVTMSFGDVHGWLALSSLYGSYNVSSEYEIPKDVIVNIFCPHCHAELIGGTFCAECGAPMVPMIVRGGGVVQICSRRGCKGHMLDLDGVNF